MTRRQRVPGSSREGGAKRASRPPLAELRDALRLSEVRSWKESLVALAKVLNDDGIPGDCGVAIEYGIPQTAKRIDFILSGQAHPRCAPSMTNP